MRYTGAKGKRARRLGQSFTEKEAKVLQRRPGQPGQHGQNRVKLSEFALQLREKQRAKFAYGLTEKQFYRTFLFANKNKHGQVGDNLLQLLEARFDNIVYRLGLAKTRAQARQLVNHGFFDVNGRKNDIPSLQLKSGDIVSVRESKRTKAYISSISKNDASKLPDWLVYDNSKFQGKILSVPDPKQHAESLDMRLIIEHYQRI